MSKELNIYGYPVKYKDKMDLLQKVLSVHAVVTNIEKGKNYMRPMLVKVIAFYILMGYSKETRDIIKESLNIKGSNLNQINSELTRKGYLVKDYMNFRVKYLSKELHQLKSYFLEGDYVKLFTIKFSKVK